MGKYSDLTSEIMDMCHSEKDNHIVFKQIAWNLAHICDNLDKINANLAEANDINRKTIGDIVNELESHGIKPEKEDAATGLRAELSEGADVFDGDCFICGKPVDDTNVGGIIIDGDGDSYRACAKCKNRFSKMVATIMMPNSIYF